MRTRLLHFVVVMMCVAACAQEKAFAQQQKKSKKDKEPPTQVLPALAQPPAAVAAETAKLTFHVAPLSAKGLLSQQTRDAIKALLQANHGARIVKLRAFVAGTGDARRVQTIVSEAFGEKKLGLPAVTTVQAGALAMDGAQIVIESVSEEREKRPVNPGGLAFLEAQRGADATGALEGLAKAATQAGVEAKEMLRVTCFLGSIDDAAAAQAAEARMFPAAAADFVQRLRGGSGSQAECEGVGRTAAAGAAKLVFNGEQMAFGDKDADLRLAFERLNKTMEPLGASGKDVIWSNFYTLERATDEKLGRLRTEFFRGAEPMPGLMVEGLPSPDASVGIEIVAAVRN